MRFLTPRHSLQMHLSTVFLMLVLSVGAVIGGLAYWRMGEIITDASGNLFGRISSEAVAGIERLYAPAEVAVEMLALHDIVRADTLVERLQGMPFLSGILDQSPELASVYVGYDDGDFVLLRRIRDDAARIDFGAPSAATYLVQAVERTSSGRATGSFVFLDRDLRAVGAEQRPSYAEYDPRTRPWFQQAQVAGRQVKTSPYVFFTTQTLGSTVAMRVPGGGATVGVDIYLDTLAETLHAQRLTENTEVALFGRDLGMIAHPDTRNVVAVPPAPPGETMRPVQRSIDELTTTVLPHVAEEAIAGGVTQADGEMLRSEIRVDGDIWRIQVSPVEIRGSMPYYLAIAVPEAELLANARQLLRQAAAVIVLILAITIPITLTTAKQIAKPVRRLADEAEKIRRFDFTDPIRVESSIIEIEDLSRAMNGMKATIRRFLEINRTISEETDFAQLLETLLEETGSIVGAKHGAVYLVSEDAKTLEPAANLNEEAPDLQGYPMDGLPAILQEAIVKDYTYATSVEGASLAICGGDPDAPENPDRNALIVPLFNRSEALIGMMTLVRERKGDGSLVRFVDMLSGSAAVALETRQLIASQKALFQAFIRMIADAIDAKSPYTGGHCARVPELTKMLAEAAHRADAGPFADLKLTEEDREAIHLAAWLHDCGKVTTPEYVVDKATKLETLYDRIHEIRMRFEVLKRDAWIAYWEGLARGGDADALAATRDETLAALDADFAFVAECNEGGEFMSPDRIDRLQAIAARTWTRTLSDRIGISHEELGRKNATPEPSLPVEEPLLADRPDHVLERRPEDVFEPDNPWGFKLDQPKHLYNRGELYNLAIARGTLTAEERYKINDHIVQTIVMLSRLPFPRHLRHVPELAGGHHEKMDGTGYPKRLRREDMSPIARIMAIADIFEALTAVDRPYKKGKTLSEALKIMGFMVKDHHIDGELYDLFLTSGVWRDYAKRYMKPEQIDEVDIEAFRPKLAA